MGSAQDNLTLSRARAKTIATYFRKKAVNAQIFYDGFGEKILATATGDNVPEAKNRRAIYILTNVKPRGIAKAHHPWKRL